MTTCNAISADNPLPMAWASVRTAGTSRKLLRNDANPSGQSYWPSSCLVLFSSLGTISSPDEIPTRRTILHPMAAAWIEALPETRLRCFDLRPEGPNRSRVIGLSSITSPLALQRIALEWRESCLSRGLKTAAWWAAVSYDLQVQRPDGNVLQRLRSGFKRSRLA